VAAAALTCATADPGTSMAAHLEENVGAALIEFAHDPIQELDAAA
jgi:aryl-alcohol dehydrogenase-like predicted oxidoreductase